MHGGPTSRLEARREFAYRLLDAYLAAKRKPDPELELELVELFGPRPAPEDRPVIRARSETARLREAADS